MIAAWWQRRWVQLVVVGVIALSIGAAIGGGSNDASTSAQSTPVPIPTVTVTAANPAIAVARHNVADARRQARQESRKIARLSRKVTELKAKNAASSHAAAAPAAPVQHSCTRTSTGSCIHGGEFCSASAAGTYGYDADGTRYLCTDGHWED